MSYRNHHPDLPPVEPAHHHFLHAKSVVTAVEPALDFERFLASYNHDLRPQSQPELDLVIEIAVAQWRLRRLWAIETAAIDIAMLEQNDFLNEHFADIDDSARLCLAVDLLGDRSRIFSILHTMESRCRRHYTQAIRDLKEIRRLVAESLDLDLPLRPFPPIPGIQLLPTLPFRETARRAFNPPPPAPTIDPAWKDPNFRYRPTLVQKPKRK